MALAPLGREEPIFGLARIRLTGGNRVREALRPWATSRAAATPRGALGELGVAHFERERPVGRHPRRAGSASPAQ
jgi:hypothetical protein